MKETYSINGAHQLQSLKSALPYLVTLFIIFVFLSLSDPAIALSFVGVIFLLSFLPVIGLHILYGMANRTTMLTIDRSLNEFTIRSIRGYYRYSMKDIEQVERNRLRNQVNVPWAKYGYLRLKMNDGNEFFFTSLMIDPQNPPFASTTTCLRIYPTLQKDKADYAEIKRDLHAFRERKIAEYRKKFAQLSLEQLLKKTGSQHYTYEAREAAEQVLEDRRNMPFEGPDQSVNLSALTCQVIAYQALEERFSMDIAVDWALDMVKEGCDTPSLWILAGLSKPANYYDTEPQLRHALDELGFSTKTGEAAVKSYCSYHIEQIAQGNNVRNNLSPLSDMVNWDSKYPRVAYDFYELYWAWIDLDSDETQYYWEGANRRNIETICVLVAREWVAENRKFYANGSGLG